MREPQSRHHRKPTSIGGTSEPRNVIRLPAKKHEAWHLLFQNRTAQEIADLINRFYLDPDYELIARKR
jgi:hypothetical protein